MRDNIDRDFWEAVTKFDDRYRPKTISISLSSSFMAKARCKKCGGHPTVYYAMFRPGVWSDVVGYRKFSPRSRRWVRRMCSSWYKEYSPKEFHDVFEFTFRLDYKNYNPLLHRTRGSDVIGRDNIIECLSCECGQTSWAFNQESVKRRLEIVNRKGKYAYPQRFVK
jgi:hypothetical protein